MSGESPKGPGRRPKGGTSQTYRVIGIGAELGVVIAGMAYVGYLVDQWYDTGPWGAFIGSMLGIIGGCYNAIKAVNANERKNKRERK